MRLDGARAVIPTRRLGGDPALLPEVIVPADRAGRADAEPLGRLQRDVPVSMAAMTRSRRSTDKADGMRLSQERPPSNQMRPRPATQTDSTGPDTALRLVGQPAFWGDALIREREGRRGVQGPEPVQD